MTRKALRSGVAILAGSLGLALGSVVHQRVGPLQRVEGEGFCPGREPCEVPALGGGFPLPWLVDDPQISVPGAISPVEDEVRGGALAADALFYLALIAAGNRAMLRLRGGARDGGASGRA